MKIFKRLKRFPRNMGDYLLAINLKKVTQNALVLGLAVAVAGGYLWYSRLYMTNERKFWLAIDNSMTTASVTRTMTTGGSGNAVTQKQQFFFAPQMVSRSYVSYTQKTATIDTKVETEGVSYPDANYSRYTSFYTNQTKEDGSAVSLDEIIGKWEGTEVPDESLDAAKENYVGELVTLAIFGNYSPDFRRTVIRAMQSNSGYELLPGSTVARKGADGKEEISYQINVKLKPYAEQLQAAFVEAGYGPFMALDPENFNDDSKVLAEFVVDASTSTLKAINYGTRKETYASYGITTTVNRPSPDFSGGELEAIVQEEIQDAL